MTRSQLVASLVASLAWPVAAIIGLLIVRPVLVALSKRVRALEYGGLKADLEALDRASATTSQTELSQGPAPKALPSAPAVAQLIAASPATAVEQAWRRLRHAVLHASYAVTNEAHSEEEALQVLHKEKLLPVGATTLFPILSSIRQRVYYDGVELAPAAALEFVVQADRIADEIERAVAPPNPEDYPASR